MVNIKSQLQEVDENREMTEPRLMPAQIKGTVSTALLGENKALKALKDWPTSPKPIKNPFYIGCFKLLVDFTLFVCATAFLAFALAVNHYDQAATSEHRQATDNLQSATKYGPTVFPILFASIVGRASHSILQWRIEKGDRIGVLDTLAGSTSLTNTVVSLFQLRVLSGIGLTLLAIWAASPVGGQASIRQMTLGTRLEAHNATFQYMSYSGSLYTFQNSNRDSQYGIVAALFGSTLLASNMSKSSSLDPWGNIKIPKIEYFEKHSSPDGDGWFDTQHANATTYAALVGVPFTGVNDTIFIDYRFRMHIPYVQLECTQTPSLSSRADIPAGSLNATGPYEILYWSTDSRQRVWSYPNRTEPFNFTYMPFPDISLNQSLVCNVTATYVELDILCAISTTCMAQRTRRSRLHQFPSSWTLLDTYYDNWNLVLAGFMFAARTQSRQNQLSLFDQYLNNPDDVIGPRFSTSRWCETRDCSERLGQLLNSQIMFMSGLFAIPRGLNNDTAFYWAPDLAFDGFPQVIDSNGTREYSTCDRGHCDRDGDDFKARVWSSQGTKSMAVEIIIAHKGWVATLSIVSILLIILCLIPPTARYFLIHGPDLIMNLSSLGTQDTSQIGIPSTGTYLDPSERARLLKHVKIRFGDINGNNVGNGDNIGYLRIASFDSKEDTVRRIRKGRWYT